MAPDDRALPHQHRDAEAASGRSFGMRAVSYAEAAERLLDNGYAPLPIVPRGKAPIPKQWTTVAVDIAQVEAWARAHPDAGVGLRTGALVGIDLDIEDADLAHWAAALVEARLGDTLIRVGRWPRRLLIYRTDRPFSKLKGQGVEILGKGQQFVAFGIHPGTHRPYAWTDETPLDVALEDLPLVDKDGCHSLVAELAQLHPDPEPTRGRRRAEGGPGAVARGPTRDNLGRVVDGRDGWLSAIAFHAVHDAMDAGRLLDAAGIADTAWRRFEATTDLERPRQDGSALYGPGDATRKVADKLRLLREGRLPSRAAADVEPPDLPEAVPAEDARALLEAALAEGCRRVLDWHAGVALGSAPQIGVKATVGLGKTAVARRQLIALRAELAAAEKPSRILILTPSLALADETAEAWRAAGERVAVLRGYERQHPTLRRPMCTNLPAVKAATEAGEDVHEAACRASSGRRCAGFEGCLKQANRVEVADADVVVAAYDALFTGFAFGAESIGLIVIDEGCWRRAHEALSGLRVETFVHEHLGAQTRWHKPEAFGAAADLHDLRIRACQAIEVSGSGLLLRRHLVAAGLTVDEAQLAGQLERRRMRDAGLYPGMPAEALKEALRQAALNARSRLYAAAWEAMRRLLAGSAEADGRFEIGLPDAEGQRSITVQRLKTIHPTLLGKPVLHLDATLRPEIAKAILPDLEVTEIAADAPNMQLRLVSGPFGKGSLCDSPGADPAERRRRANRLGECVDHVRWHARRFERTLVITYKDIEAAFSDIPGVAVAHFNAVAGLDLWRDVGLLVVIGRPLPGSVELGRMSGALFGHAPRGGYRKVQMGILMRSGIVRGVRVTAHADATAEVLRAAICDDELIQAIGRGRGVNRTAAHPLEVHVLADVALPLVHDRLSCWELEAPDVMQRMLLAGVATDSPADATALHPQLFVSTEAAKKQLQRWGAKGQTPIRDTYREMSLCSAAYRRLSAGHWQRAWWLDGDATCAKAALERAIGPLAEWRPD